MSGPYTKTYSISTNPHKNYCRSILIPTNNPIYFRHEHTTKPISTTHTKPKWIDPHNKNKSFSTRPQKPSQFRFTRQNQDGFRKYPKTASFSEHTQKHSQFPRPLRNPNQFQPGHSKQIIFHQPNWILLVSGTQTKTMSVDRLARNKSFSASTQNPIQFILQH